VSQPYQDSRVGRRMARIDALSPEIRQLVHEEGLTVVGAFLDLGVTAPRHIRHLISTVRCGSNNGGMNPLQREAAHRSLGIDDEVVTKLKRAGLAVVPLEPTPRMIDASIALVRDHTEAMTKPEKHRRRLQAAILAAARGRWPHLFP
jgi:hypothetical protein